LRSDADFGAQFCSEAGAGGELEGFAGRGRKHSGQEQRNQAMEKSHGVSKAGRR
jgi:hypothetical protein